MAVMKHTLKDSVFSFVFGQPKYARELYLAIHPEDTDVTEADCKLVTLENILTTGMYNDWGLQVRNMLLLFVEAQSTFTINIVLRLLLYLAETYKEYVEEHKLNLYGATPVKIPRPEMYVIYTGDRDVPETLFLSDLYDGKGAVEIQVKVLRSRGTGDIVDQYVRFCKISDEERRKHGRTEKAISEIICRCIEEKVLAPFLEARQKEVAEIMVTLFDQEKIMEIHDYHIAEAARREGIQKGRTEGRAEGLVDALKSLIQNSGMAAENAMELLGIPETARSQYAEMLKQ